MYGTLSNLSNADTLLKLHNIDISKNLTPFDKYRIKHQISKPCECAANSVNETFQDFIEKEHKLTNYHLGIKNIIKSYFKMDTMLFLDAIHALLDIMLMLKNNDNKHCAIIYIRDRFDINIADAQTVLSYMDSLDLIDHKTSFFFPLICSQGEEFLEDYSDITPHIEYLVLKRLKFNDYKSQLPKKWFLEIDQNDGSNVLNKEILDILCICIDNNELENSEFFKILFERIKTFNGDIFIDAYQIDENTLDYEENKTLMYSFLKNSIENDLSIISMDQSVSGIDGFKTISLDK